MWYLKISVKKGETMGQATSSQSDNAKNDDTFIRFVETFSVKSLPDVNVPSSPAADYAQVDLDTGRSNQVDWLKKCHHD